MNEYEDLLEKYHENKPEETEKHERLDIPEPRTNIQGGKTYINNFKKITKTLRRDPKHLLKFISKELATAGNLEGKQASLKGKFKKRQIKKKISLYVKKFVICEECGKADTKLEKFKGESYKRCEACGARSPVKSI